MILATASHFPASNSNLEQGRQSSASKVPLSLSPAVISIEGCIALDAVQMAITIGINKDNANPACSPLVAASALSQSPSHFTGFKVTSGSRFASTNVPLTTSDSHSPTAVITRDLASFDASLVDKYKIANFHSESFACNLKIA